MQSNGSRAGSSAEVSRSNLDVRAGWHAASTHLARRGLGLWGRSVARNQLDAYRLRRRGMGISCIKVDRYAAVHCGSWVCSTFTQPPMLAHAFHAPGDWQVPGRSIVSTQRAASHGSLPPLIMVLRTVSRPQRSPQRADGLATTAGSGSSGLPPSSGSTPIRVLTFPTPFSSSLGLALAPYHSYVLHVFALSLSQAAPIARLSRPALYTGPSDMRAQGRSVLIRRLRS